jgi:hypothetical protein
MQSVKLQRTHFSLTRLWITNNSATPIDKQRANSMCSAADVVVIKSLTTCQGKQKTRGGSQQSKWLHSSRRSTWFSISTKQAASND